MSVIQAITWITEEANTDVTSTFPIIELRWKDPNPPGVVTSFHLWFSSQEGGPYQPVLKLGVPSHDAQGVYSFYINKPLTPTWAVLTAHNSGGQSPYSDAKFLPEPCGFTMLAVGILFIAGLNKWRKRKWANRRSISLVR